MTIDWNKLLAMAAAGELDGIDWQILDAIHNQRMMQYAQIADLIGVHARTVKRRIRSLVSLLT